MIYAICGNPNSGKTTLFNTLTGSTAHVGNWPGVTVEKKSGFYKTKTDKVEIIDLPGIYSLSPYTPEEIIARNYILKEKPDLIINIVDATSLERSLYLTTQLLETGVPVIVALNMIDEARRDNIRIDAEILSRRLNVPVIPISAIKREGIADMMEKASKTVRANFSAASVLENSLLGNLFNAIKVLFNKSEGHRPYDYKKESSEYIFSTAKLIEGDRLVIEQYPEIAKTADGLKEKDFADISDFQGAVTKIRYTFVEEICAECFIKPDDAMTKSQKIDSILTHKYLGIPIFIFIMLAIFHLTFSENFLFIGVFIPEGTFDWGFFGTDAINSPGVILFNMLEALTGYIDEGLRTVMPAGTWYTGLLLDGLLAGVFAVLSFIPQIMLLFLFISILEDSGYMARAAFIMDRVFRRFGLSGKAFMPLFVCFGCAVPGIMGTRILENEGERKRAIFLSPFFSCGAKLPIWAAFAAVFGSKFGFSGELIVVAMYALGIIVAVLAALLLKKLMMKGNSALFIIELPAYRTPRFTNTVMSLWQNLKHYLIRAATIIAGSVIVIWFLSNFTFTFRMTDDGGESMLGIIGKGLTYIFYPMGFAHGSEGWKFVVSALTGLIAKEMVVASMGAFASGELSDMLLNIGGTWGTVNAAFPAMFAFMAFNLLGVPCMAAVSAARAELKGGKHFWLAILFWLSVAYIISTIIFWLGMFFIVNWWAALLTVTAIIAIAIAAPILLKKFKHSPVQSTT